MGALKHRDVSGQKPFADTTKQAKEVAAAGPNAFHRVIVNFPNAVTIIIARPFAASWRMTDGLVKTSRGGEVLIGRPFISVDDRIGARMGDH